MDQQDTSKMIRQLRAALGLTQEQFAAKVGVTFSTVKAHRLYKVGETAENRVLEWRATVAVCQYSGKKWVLDACVRLLGGFRHDMLEFSRQI